MTTLLSPFDLSRVDQQSGRTFRKQILRKGTINYQGQRITFDDSFCSDVVRAFHTGAYDQVPFVLADMSNRHNMDPERYRGEIVDMEVTEDGVDAIVKTTKQGARAIESNPRLGVSARIVQGLEKVDGRRFKRAIQHVLATMDPRLTGLRPWEAVDLSDEVDEDEEVLDLTNAKMKEGKAVATKTARRRPAKDGVLTFDLSKLDDEQFQILLSAAVMEADAPADDGVIEETVTRKTKKPVRTATRRRPRQVVVEPDPEEDEDELEEDDEFEDTVAPDEDDEDLEDEELEDDEELEEEAPEEDVEEEPVSRKKEKGKRRKVPSQHRRVEMSNPVKRKKVTKARRLELELAEERWANKKIQLIDAGVPPALLDLAEPIMKQPDQLVIDLSETGDRAVDARLVIGRVLEEVSGMIDLAPEMGHGISSVSDDKDDETRKKLNVWTAEYGKP